MCCGLGKLVNYITCGCFSACLTTVEDDKVSYEESVLIPAIFKMSEKINRMKQELDEASALREMYYRMKDRRLSHYSKQERTAFYNLTSASNPSPFSSLTRSAAFQPATGMRQRGVPDDVKRAAQTIQTAVEEQKYHDGVKIGNWDGIKAGILREIIRQVEKQGVQDEQLIQVLNALPREIKRDFAGIGIEGLSIIDQRHTPGGR